MIVDIVRRFASAPSLRRLMTFDGHNISDRLLWIFENNTSESMRHFTALIVEGSAKEKSAKSIPHGCVSRSMRWPRCPSS
jgi:hypothetical protein